MLYAFRFDSWVKLGWAKDPGQRAANGFWENSHPKELCGKLCLPHFECIGLWECPEKETEEELQRQFNAGELKRKDNYNEFYEILEWPKIYRELMTLFTPLPLLTEYPKPNEHMKSKRECCGGTRYYCKFCKETFSKAWNWKRHLETCKEKKKKFAKTK